MSYGRHAAYIPLSALTDAEQARYRREASESQRKYPHLWKGNAAGAGLRARIVSERPRPGSPEDRDADYDW